MKFMVVEVNGYGQFQGNLSICLRGTEEMHEIRDICATGPRNYVVGMLPSTLLNLRS